MINLKKTALIYAVYCPIKREVIESGMTALEAENEALENYPDYQMSEHWTVSFDSFPVTHDDWYACFERACFDQRIEDQYFYWNW